MKWLVRKEVSSVRGWFVNVSLQANILIKYCLEVVCILFRIKLSKRGQFCTVKESCMVYFLAEGNIKAMSHIILEVLLQLKYANGKLVNHSRHCA
jgi:hypothetical protein